MQARSRLAALVPLSLEIYLCRFAVPHVRSPHAHLRVDAPTAGALPCALHVPREKRQKERGREKEEIVIALSSKVNFPTATLGDPRFVLDMAPHG